MWPSRLETLLALAAALGGAVDRTHLGRGRGQAAAVPAAAAGGQPVPRRPWAAAFQGQQPPLPRQLLVDQLTAVCQAARETPVQVMFPMVVQGSEVAAALSLLREAAGGDPPAGLGVGIMIEVPAAALMLQSLAAG